MKRAFKIYGWAWVVLLVVTVITILVMWIYPTHHKMAKKPNKIERIVDIDLPDLKNIESSDNLDRGASRWDCYSHSADFVEPLSAETINELDRRCNTDSEHWSKEVDGCYVYCDNGGIDDLYFVYCWIYNDEVHIEYMVDETEGIFVFLPFVFIYIIFILWGIVLCIAAVFNWAMRGDS